MFSTADITETNGFQTSRPVQGGLGAILALLGRPTKLLRGKVRALQSPSREVVPAVATLSSGRVNEMTSRAVLFRLWPTSGFGERGTEMPRQLAIGRVEAQILSQQLDCNCRLSVGEIGPSHNVQQC